MPLPQCGSPFCLAYRRTSVILRFSIKKTEESRKRQHSRLRLMFAPNFFVGECYLCPLRRLRRHLSRGERLLLPYSRIMRQSPLPGVPSHTRQAPSGTGGGGKKPLPAEKAEAFCAVGVGWVEWGGKMGKVDRGSRSPLRDSKTLSHFGSIRSAQNDAGGGVLPPSPRGVLFNFQDIFRTFCIKSSFLYALLLLYSVFVIMMLKILHRGDLYEICLLW